MADTNEPVPSPEAFLELANEYAEATKRLHALRRKGKNPNTHVGNGHDGPPATHL